MKSLLRLVWHHPAVCWAPYLLVLLVGFVAFVRRNPVCETPAFAATPVGAGAAGAARVDRAGRTNLASLYKGARVRVSTANLERGHHPIFAIDGETQPSYTEKWATLPYDRDPFIEVILAKRSDVSRVSLLLAGGFEGAAHTMRFFTIQCLQGDPRASRLVHEHVVRNNEDTNPSFDLPCSGTDRVRVHFDVAPHPHPRAVVRLYEIEVWGQEQGS